MLGGGRNGPYRRTSGSTCLTLQLGRSRAPLNQGGGTSGTAAPPWRRAHQTPSTRDHGIIHPLMSSIARQVVLVALLLAAVLGLFVVAVSGQRRLEDASRHVQHAAQRQVAL
jgi:hypothetical protein